MKINQIMHSSKPKALEMVGRLYCVCEKLHEMPLQLPLVSGGWYTAAVSRQKLRCICIAYIFIFFARVECWGS